VRRKGGGKGGANRRYNFPLIRGGEKPLSSPAKKRGKAEVKTRRKGKTAASGEGTVCPLSGKKKVQNTEVRGGGGGSTVKFRITENLQRRNG